MAAEFTFAIQDYVRRISPRYSRMRDGELARTAQA